LKIKLENKVSIKDIIDLFGMHEKAKQIWNLGKEISEKDYAYNVSFTTENAVYDQTYEELTTDTKILIHHYNESNIYKKLIKILEEEKLDFSEKTSIVPESVAQEYSKYVKEFNKLISLNDKLYEIGKFVDSLKFDSRFKILRDKIKGIKNRPDLEDFFTTLESPNLKIEYVENIYAKNAIIDDDLSVIDKNKDACVYSGTSFYDRKPTNPNVSTIEELIKYVDKNA